MYFNNWSQNATGKKDEIRTDRFSGESYNSISLTFDVAYWSYTNQSEQDTLQVLVSTDCGATFTQVYNKGGATLSTVPGNSTTSFTPTSTQWRKETINLNSYISQSFMIAFRNVARFGNNLYLDNISVNATVSVNAGVDKTICIGSSTSIGSSSSSGINYSWSPTTALSSSTISNPTASPSITQQYILTATHAVSGISTNDTTIVTVNQIIANITNASLASSMCRNISVSIPFTVACPFNTGNVFTAQLSDATGNFTSPISIGTLTGTGSGTITGLIPSNTALGTGYRIRIVTSSPITTGNNNGTNISIVHCTFTYNVKLFIQGYYIGSGTMRAAMNPVLYPSISDSVKIELHNSTSPYSLTDFNQSTINTNGTGQFLLSTTSIGQAYYIVIKHRNALETWSASPVSISSGGTYDFSNAVNKAFGSNQILASPGVYAIYSGDISNGISGGTADGQINTSDFNELQSSLGLFTSTYNYHDLTGDFQIESMDYSLIENNINLNLVVKKP